MTCRVGCSRDGFVIESINQPGFRMLRQRTLLLAFNIQSPLELQFGYCGNRQVNANLAGPGVRRAVE